MPPVNLFAVADGDISNWTVVPGGTPAFQAVGAVHGPQDDVVYVQSGTGAGSPEIFVQTCSTAALPPISGVGWVGVFARTKKIANQPSLITFLPEIRSAGIQMNGSVVESAGFSYADYDPNVLLELQFALDPATGKPWTLAAALACQVGIKDDTTNSGHAGGVYTLRCSRISKVLFAGFLPNHGAVRGPAPPGWMP